MQPGVIKVAQNVSRSNALCFQSRNSPTLSDDSDAETRDMQVWRISAGQMKKVLSPSYLHLLTGGIHAYVGLQSQTANQL